MFGDQHMDHCLLLFLGWTTPLSGKQRAASTVRQSTGFALDSATQHVDAAELGKWESDAGAVGCCSREVGQLNCAGTVAAI